MTRWTEEDVRAIQARARGLNPGFKSRQVGPSKYGNRKHIDAEGIEHDSRKEYLRWCVLKDRERIGAISDLHRQVVFDLIVAGVLVARFIADATYREAGALVVEDTKSPITRSKPDFRMKLKLMKACHGIDVRVVE